MRYLNPGVLTLAALSLLALGQCKRDGGRHSDADRGGPPPQTYADAQSAATESLVAFRGLVNEKNFRQLGFESLDDVRGATLGPPLRVLFVRLDQLRQYQPGSDPSALLGDTRQLSFPVLVRGQARSSVVVREVEGKWRTGSLGNGALAAQIAAARAPAAQAAPGAAPQEDLVHVGALGLYFIARRVDNRLTLTPLANHPELNLRGGAALPAEEVFAALADAARNLRDDAPA